MTTKQQLELILEKLEEIDGQNSNSDKLLYWLAGYVTGLIDNLDE